MNFKLNIEEYNLLKKYVDFSGIESVETNDIDQTVTVDDNDLIAFQLSVSGALNIYGFDSDDEITDFGRKLEALYDNLYSQIQ